jgi:8-oxo-dGTP pyrophosphatase MutT (NUDIX family)
MQSFDDIPGVEVWLIDLPEVLVTLGRDETPEPSPAVAEHWQSLCRDNDRLYDGPILSVVSLDIPHAHIHARRDRYSRLAVQPQVKTGVRLLAVTGVLTACDQGGREYVMMGKRSDKIHAYPGLWEFGPAGGMAVPPVTIDRFGMELLGAHLKDEIMEEAGVDISLSTMTPCALVRDHLAMSDDVVIRCDLGVLDDAAQVPNANWEYTQVRWIPLDALPNFLAGPEQFIPPAPALARALGWLDSRDS